MKAIDIHATLEGIRSGRIMAMEPQAQTLTQLTPFHPGAGAIHLGRLNGQTPWERHPDGDKLLHVLEGELDITLLAAIGLLQETVRAGSILVVPRGLWHRLNGREAAILAVVPRHGESSAHQPALASLPA
ncbi:cupin domain-containing protein [Pseudomonas tohonis]|uniref:cupin domain-containing protein n=1 Tax=Pseudomonas tohonis TaxID=2725477 RepID=UPI0021DAC44B|nr:cupin domain-containing protein [Pseudomonas tohonis]UXY53737.1 cupin domain-containing protein [Pseudomonas tohonis]